jgi:membrane associated rhomboid family serine protease
MMKSQRLADNWPAVRQRLLIIAALCAAMVLVHLFSWVIWPIRTLGIHPRDPGSAWMIVTAPFVHGDLGHLGNNLAAFAILSAIAMVRGVGHYLRASLIIILLGGALVWLFGRSAVHIGASGWIFGLWSLVIVEAWFDRSPRAIAISLAVLFFYGSMAWGVLPMQAGVSFESHLFGALAGVAAAYWLHRPQLRATAPAPAGPKFWP